MPEDPEGDLKNNLYLLIISKKYESRPDTPEMLRVVDRKMKRMEK